LSVAYVDSSALVKLVVPEAESEAVEASLRGFDRSMSSQLAVVEVGRAALRVHGPSGLALAARVLELFDIMPIDDAVVHRARALAPPSLRSLDAIHLASALLPPVAPTVVAFDERLIEAARSHGLVTVSPGRDG